MSAYQIILKTIATTLNFVVTLVALVNERGEDLGMKRACCIFCLANLIGIWS